MKGNIVCDTRTDNYDVCEEGVVYLDHSCSEWVIGGKEQMRALIDDLTAIMEGRYVSKEDDD